MRNCHKTNYTGVTILEGRSIWCAGLCLIFIVSHWSNIWDNYRICNLSNDINFTWMNSVSFWTVSRTLSEKKLPFHSNTYKGRLNVLRCEIRHLRILLVFYKSFFEADLSSDISLRAMSVVANRLMYDPSSFIKIIAYSSLIWQWWSAKCSGDIFTAKVNSNCIACSVDRGLTKYRFFCSWSRRFAAMLAF